MAICNIIIPTYNRPDYLRRILGYYGGCGKDFKVIVADSSSNDIKEINRKTISSVPSLDIQYLGGYSPEMNPHHKMADMVNYAEGEYCLFCADDDFVTPNGIIESVDFLEKNKDFAVAHGQYISFRLEEDERGKQQFGWKFAYSHESITFSDPAMRLSHHLSDYSQPTIYGVHRAALMKMVYEELLKSKVDPIFFGELLPSMLTIIYGKMKCLDVLYAARDEGSIRNTSNIGDSIHPGYWPSLKDAIETGVYDEEYPKFRDCLSTHLSKQSQLDMEESKKVVDDAMSANIKKSYYPPKSKASFISRAGYILDSLNLPDWADRGLRGLYAELTKSRQAKKHAIDMPQSSKYYADFNKIRHHVLSYSK
jgi:glycosyltransferase domain-containing protein